MGNKFNILLIEDNAGDAKLVEIYLRESPSLDFDITHAKSLAAGVNVAQEHKKYDVVLLDLSLPDSSGFETLTKAMAELPANISIVVLTGLDDESLGLKAVETGAQDYLVKGQIDTNSLTRSVLHAVQRRKMQLEVEATARNLKISEQRLLQAQKIAKIGNYELEADSKKMYWSEEIFRILGLPPNKGVTAWDDYLDHVHPNDKEKVRENVQTAIDNGEPFNFEHIILTADTQKVKYIRDQGQVEMEEDGTIKLIGTLQDITEYKRAEKLLIQSEARYRTIFEQSQDSIYISTSKGLFVEFNDSLLKLLGYAREEFTQVHSDDLYVSDEDRKKFTALIDEKGSVKDFEAQLKKKNGEVIDCLLTATLWKSMEGNVKGYHGIIRDITALKQTQELIKAKEVAEQAAKMREQFLANMSHEIRTPMNVVVGMTHLLENTPLDRQQLEYIEALKLSSDTLLRLINNILDFSKIESGKLELEQRPFKLQHLITDIIQTYKFKAREKRINLFTQVDVCLPETIVGDSVRLEQVINNLVSNAIKYTDKGEVLLRVEVLDETLDDVNIKFAVKDTGIGIPQAKQESVFQSFTQASENTTRLYGGTGLGLSIAKQLVDLFGGRIMLESEEGKGSTFFFVVKFKKDLVVVEPKRQRVNGRASQENKHALNSSPQKSTLNDEVVSVYTAEDVPEEELEAAQKGQSEPIDILLVEDHKLNQIVATDLLKKWAPNVNLTIANNGKEAVDKLEKTPVYDVILMDISMPIMDGYQTTEHIRNKMSSPTKDLPIIAMTAHAFNKNAQQCFDVGMNEFVSKPINPKVLYAKLNKIFSKFKAFTKKAKRDLEQGVVATVVTTQKSMETTSNKLTRNHKNNGEMVETQVKLLNLAYLESLTGGDPMMKAILLETMVNDLPAEIKQIETDYKQKNWEQLKKSAHKMKSSCDYMGLKDMREIAKTIENNSWERKELDKMGPLVQKLCKVCRQAHIELEAELKSLN